jgi:uroporphyrinogen-III synthase
MDGHAGALAGRCVLVTRPRAQALPLCEAIVAAGGEALLFPLIDIEALDDPDALQGVAGLIERAALAVFVSANAVRHAFDLLPCLRRWPAGLRAATVGEQSAQALRERGVPEVVVPQARFDSEALLALPELSADALGGRIVLIFRGDGGRELLGDTLRERGAQVRHVTCYRRTPPRGDAAQLCDAVRAGRLHALTITSSEAVRNLAALDGIECLDALRRLPLFAPHARIAGQARACGFTQVVETAPADAGLMAGLIHHFSPPSGGRAD